MELKQGAYHDPWSGTFVLIVPSGIETNFWVQTVVQATRVLIVPSGIETVEEHS